jgi:hypothetical protein
MGPPLRTHTQVRPYVSSVYFFNATQYQYERVAGTGAPRLGGRTFPPDYSPPFFLARQRRMD